MPKPTVKAETSVEKTRRIQQDDISISSVSTPSDNGWNRLSYLHGATVDGGSNDMGCESDPGTYASLDYPDPNWRADWQARRDLRRHTVDQGSSTFSWPQKR